MWPVLSRTFREFASDECPRLAAALTYYTFFALPALLVVIVFLAGLLLNDREAIQERLQSHFEETIGPAGAQQMTAILKNASQPSHSGWGWAVGMGMLLLGATGALQELQTAVNRAWRVEPDPAQGGIQRFLLKRLLSVALLVGIAVLLIASIVVSWSLAAFGNWLDAHPAYGLSSGLVRWLHTGLSLAVFTVLFAALFRFLPDAHVDWSDVWLGAIVTTLLFWLGQGLLGVYLTWSRPTSAYGAAGSLALVLLWMYYSALIFFLGAEFTHALSEYRGKRVTPVRGARHAACTSARAAMAKAA
jgi:membrane protein